MGIKDFAIERYFARYEFSTTYLLSSSDCDGFSLKYVLDLASEEEINSWHNLKLGYTETTGSPALRKAISKHYKTIRAENVLVSSPGEASFALMNVLLQNGDNVICMSPIYQSLYQVAETLGCTISFWEPEPGREWYYSPSRLQKLITKRTKLIVVNFPHNPTGYIPAMDDWNEIIKIAGENDLVLFSDEMYRSLIFDKKDEIPAACDLYENAVSLWGMAKSFGLAGLRIGWLASRNERILKKIEAFKDYLSICNSATSEILATIALNNCISFIMPNIEKIKSNIESFRQFQLRNSDLLEFYQPKAGSTAFIKLKIKSTALQYAEELIEKTGIMLLPSEIFGYGTSHARIGFGRANLPEILTVWEKFHGLQELRRDHFK
jgi:aspartate/methionine/tyrosine aminotransferase